MADQEARVVVSSARTPRRLLANLPFLGFLLAVALWFVFEVPFAGPAERLLMIAQSVTAAILIIGLVVVTAFIIRKRSSRAEGLAATLVLVSTGLFAVSIVWMNLGPLMYSYREVFFTPATALYELALNFIPFCALAAWLLRVRGDDHPAA